MAKFDVDPDLVRKLAGLLEETGLDEIEYANQSQRIRVARLAATTSAASGGNSGTHAGSDAAPVIAVERRDEPHPGTVTSPMVGTAYVAEQPGGEPLVSVGDSVAKGQTLLIIEAMKVMNPIPSTRDGTVRKIMVEDKQPVEYGEPLMIID